MSPCVGATARAIYPAFAAMGSVHACLLSRAGIAEAAFASLFRGLVYPQIWEDPVVDMDALAIGPRDHIVAIATVNQVSAEHNLPYGQ